MTGTRTGVVIRQVFTPKVIRIGIVSSGDDIAMLIAGARAQGIQMTLKDAYDRAVRSNPVTWAKEQARIAEDAATKARKEDADRAAAAARARQSRPRTSGHQAHSTVVAGSMDETMQKTLDNIRERERRA